MPDVLCPNCLDKGGLHISTAFQARPIGTYSLAGGQLKFSLVEVPQLSCTLCDWTTIGSWDGPGHAIFPDPHS